VSLQQRTDTERAAPVVQTPPAGPVMSQRQIVLVFVALMLGMLLAALDQTIVSTALPTMVGELGGLEHLSWVITAYLLTSTVSLPIYGKLSDLYGRKPLFQFGLVAFLAGSLLSGAAQNMTMLIAFRAVQGLGAGGIMGMALAIIGDIIPPRQRGKYQGYMGSVFAVASVAGPLLGGFFVDQLSWRWVFYINLPIGILALFVTARALRVVTRRLEHEIDYLGAALMVGSVTSLLLVTTWGGHQLAWTSVEIIGLATAGVALLAAFIWQERRASEPMLPLRLFREPIFAVSSGIAFVVGLSMFGAVAFIPVYLQIVKGASATGSGLRMLPMMVGVLSTMILSGQAISRMGRYKIFPISGAAVLTCGLVLLSRLSVDSGPLAISLAMFVTGAGVGLVMQVTVLVVQNAVAFRDLGTATAGVTFFRSMGGAFGVAIFGSILNNRLDQYLTRYVPQEALAGISRGALTSSPAAIHRLPPVVVQGVLHAFSQALHVVYISAIPFAFVAFVLAWMLREIPLRDTVHSAEDGAPAPLAVD
jgi:EmrB/QacA subfamily drug resistance transporter